MNVVEKAAERLRARRANSATTAVPPPASPDHRPRNESPSPTIARLHKRAPVANVPPQAPSPPSPASAAEAAVSEAAIRGLCLASTANETDRRLTNQLRRIKQPLLDNIAGRPGNLPLQAGRILVTSAAPGEGKTFIAVNLAVSLARGPDVEVVLIDADVAKADITKGLGLEDRPGLLDALTDEACAPASIVVPTAVPKLAVVPAGKQDAAAADLLGARRMIFLLDALEKGGTRQRLLVIDSGPLLTAAAGCRALLAHAGQVVVVVAAGRTQQQELKLALAGLREGQYVGLVLNMSRLSGSEGRHYNAYDDFYG